MSVQIDSARRPARSGAPSLDVTPWEPSVPLERGLTLPFPAGLLTGPARAFTAEVARFTQTPPDFAGLLFLAMLSAVFAGRAVVQVYPGYCEPLMLYVLISAACGERKSAVYNLMAEPLRQRKGELMLLDDVTPEALEAIMARTDGRVAIYGPEGGAFIDRLACGRHAPCFAIYLKGYTGEPHVSERVIRGGQDIDSPALSIGVMTQPASLTALAARDTVWERGLLSRMMFSCPQDSRVGYLVSRLAPPDAGQRAWYAGFVERLLEVRPQGAPGQLEFSAEAVAVYDQLFDSIELRRRPGGDLGEMPEWAPKLRGNLMRVAALLHLSDQAERGADDLLREPVPGETVERAALLSEYLISHARVALGVIDETPAVGQARKLLRWVQAGRRTRFTAREAQRHLARVGARRRVLDPALEVLLSHGYVRAYQGRRETYQVNPHEIANWPEVARG